MKDSVDIISMGCSKNLVDTERLMRQLELNGYHVQLDSDDLRRCDIAVVNTCGFIQDAKQESIDTILRLCEAKEEGRLKRLYVMGCLSQRYMEELGQEIPQVDKYYGKFDWPQLLNDLGKAYKHDHANERHLTTPRHYAYLKISEGCDRECAYCAIPLMTGHHRSRPMEDIEAEVRHLVRLGVKEIQVIAQELTYYGLDLYGEQRIADLVERISDIEGVEWIRLHYAYPTHFPDNLLRVMRERQNVCKYLDIALQHISTRVLANMRRHIDREQTLRLIDKIRREVPGIHLRTTLMVGFPGEGDAEFEELKAFVRETKFERMGAFAYSEEDGTYAQLHLKDDVPDTEKQRRLSELMDIQQAVSAEVQARKVGRTLRVIVDRVEGDYYIGRTEWDSPEVDPEVLIPQSGGTLEIGNFYNIRITDSEDFDLFGILSTETPD